MNFNIDLNNFEVVFPYSMNIKDLDEKDFIPVNNIVNKVRSPFNFLDIINDRSGLLYTVIQIDNHIYMCMRRVFYINQYNIQYQTMEIFAFDFINNDICLDFFDHMISENINMVGENNKDKRIIFIKSKNNA